MTGTGSGPVNAAWNRRRDRRLCFALAYDALRRDNRRKGNMPGKREVAPKEARP